MQCSEYEVEVDSMTSERWHEWLELFEDANIYQTWAYGSVRWGRTNLSHLVLKRDGEVLAIAQLRIVRSSRLPGGIAYLRWGPLCHRRGRELDPAVVNEMAAALRREYVVKRRLFLRILPGAFRETVRGKIFDAAFSDFSQEQFSNGSSYRTFSLDLEPPLEVLRKKLDQKWRNQLNRAEKNGLTILEGDGPSEFRSFIPIHEEMWARKQFDRGSDVREFERIQGELPAAHRMKVLVALKDGVPAAGLVATAMGNSAIYLLGATSDEGMKLKGSYLLHWLLITRLKEWGIRHYNLGGINPETNPGVYHFKAGFSGEDVLYMPPVAASGSVLSTTIARVGDVVKGRFGASVARWLRRN